MKGEDIIIDPTESGKRIRKFSYSKFDSLDEMNIFLERCKI